MKSKKLIYIGIAAAALIGIVLLDLFVLGIFSPDRGAKAFGFLSPDKDNVTVHFILPGDEIVKSVKKGESVKLFTPDEIPDYTFIGWRNEQNILETRERVPVFQESYYAAVYAVSLQSEVHTAYLFPNKYGFFYPDHPMTRADTAIMLDTLLSVQIYGDEGFIDVPETDDCYHAAKALKKLGVVSGSRFHPDESITKGELLEMLCSFFPVSRNQYDFADISKNDSRYSAFCTAVENQWIDLGEEMEPDHIMTRYETAVLMNRLLGRKPDETVGKKEVGFLLDIWTDDPCYQDMIEACVSHHCESKDGGEHWTESEPIAKIEEGRYLFGLELYAVGPDGHLIVNDRYTGFEFDEHGKYTSGNPELDALISELFAKILNSSMDRETMLRTAYRYCVDNYTYLRRNMYEFRNTSWAADEAYTMLSTGKGNCYNFAGAFCMMARALGYDARVKSGFLTTQDTPHAWVEMKINGVKYTFDPEIEYAYKKKFKVANMFMMTQEDVLQWNYIV